VRTLSSEAPFLAVDLAAEPGREGSNAQIVMGDDSSHIRLVRLIEDATIRWRTHIGDVVARPAVGWGTVFATTSDGTIHAIETSNGAERWSVAIGDNASAPVLFDEIVFASGGERLHALDAEDGSEVWSATLGQGTRFSPCTVHEGVLYAGGSDGKVYAVHPANGEPYWYTTIGGPIETIPTVTADQVFARSIDGNIYALDTATGEVRWRHSVGWTFEATAPILAGNTVVAGGPGGTVTALNAVNGAMRWQIRTPGVIASTPVTMGDTVYIPTAGASRRSGSISAIDVRTGTVRWRSELDTYLASSVGIDGDTIYVGDAEGYVRGFDAESGGERWCYSYLHGYAASAPVITDHTLYVGSTANGQSPSIGPVPPRAHFRWG